MNGRVVVLYFVVSSWVSCDPNYGRVQGAERVQDAELLETG